MSKEVEEWRNIEGYDGKYQVSDWGRVRDTNYRGTKNTRLRTICTNNGGYQYVKIQIDGRKKFFFIHRLVYETFVGEIPNELQINHIDECTTNNHLENLIPTTPKENSNWGSRNNKISRSKLVNHPKARQIDKISMTDGEIIMTYQSAMRAEKDGYDRHHILKACNGIYHQHKGFFWRRHSVI